jgi:hypothetical protein
MLGGKLWANHFWRIGSDVFYYLVKTKGLTSKLVRAATLSKNVEVFVKRSVSGGKWAADQRNFI